MSRRLARALLCCAVLLPGGVRAQAGVDAAVEAASTSATRADTAAGDTLTAQDGMYARPFIGSLGRAGIGGFLEGSSSYFREDGAGDGFGMELTRLNLFVVSELGSRVRVLSELAFEEGTEGVRVRAAQLDLRIHRALTLRGGVLLPPIGFLNQNHDGPRWNLVDRPLVATRIVPSTFSEPGVGLLGKFYPAGAVVSYDLYLTNGLHDGIVDNPQGRTSIPDGRSDDPFEGDNNGSPAVTGRLALGRPGGGELGASFYAGHYNDFRSGGEQVDRKRWVVIYALDGRASLGPFSFRSELALAEIDAPASMEELFAERQWGGHLDLTATLWRPLIDVDEAPSELALNLRVEHVDLNVGSFTSTGRRIYDEISAGVAGLSFRPTPDVVLRANYRHEWIRDLVGNPSVQRAGFQVGLATYF